jgi:hypothetical protein
MDLALQRRFVLDAIVAGNPADHLATPPIGQDTIDAFARNARHSGKIRLSELLTDHDSVFTDALAEMFGEFDECQRDPTPQR